MASPAAKRARGGDATTSLPALSAAECDKIVQRLSEDEARAILAKLVGSSPAAREAVTAELRRHDDAPVNLREYSSRACAIVCSLNGLRDSQIFNRSGEVSEKLTGLISECKQRLSTTRAFQAITAIMGCVDGEAEGQIRKCLLSYGSFEWEIAGELTKLAKEMGEEEKAELGAAVEDLEWMVEALKDYGSGDELAKVVKEVRGG